MNEKSRTIIKEEMLSLPKEAQEAINAFGWEKISEEIGKKYLLDEDEINTFQLETASFLLGLVDEDAYPRNIEDEIGISKEEAEKISEEVFEKIFTPINDILIGNIKKNLNTKRPKLEQNVDFIISGGNYSALLEETDNEAAPDVAKPIGTSSTLDMKDRLIN